MSQCVLGDGAWRPVGINPNYRFAKYYPVGSVFAKHIDRPTVHEHEKCSIYTVNIYLNDLSAEQVNTQPR